MSAHDDGVNATPDVDERSGAFEYVQAGAAYGGIPWYASVVLVILLGLAASIIDWAIGTGIGLATGIAFVLGCIVLGGRTRRSQLLAAFVAAPVCFAAIVTISGAAQLFGTERFAAAFGIFWTYALLVGTPWLVCGTLVSILIAGARLVVTRPPPK